MQVTYVGIALSSLRRVFVIAGFALYLLYLDWFICQMWAVPCTTMVPTRKVFGNASPLYDFTPVISEVADCGRTGGQVKRSDFTWWIMEHNVAMTDTVLFDSGEQLKSRVALYLLAVTGTIAPITASSVGWILAMAYTVGDAYWMLANLALRVQATVAYFNDDPTRTLLDVVNDLLEHYVSGADNPLGTQFGIVHKNYGAIRDI